jgi:subtilase-type serine protease
MDFAAGLLLGYSSSGTSQSTGSVNATGGQAGLYAGWKQESLHIEALAAGGLNNYTTSRNALGGTATGSTQGQQVSGQLSAGYDLKAGDVNIGPYVSGQYTSVSFNSFTETGSMAPLSFGAQSEGYLTSDLGATANRKWDLGGGVALSPMVSAAWEHVYQGNLDSLSANFGSGSNFTVNGPAMGTDAAVLGAGVKAILAKGFSAYAQYQGKLALTNYTEQNLSGGVNIGF